MAWNVQNATVHDQWPATLTHADAELPFEVHPNPQRKHNLSSATSEYHTFGPLISVGNRSNGAMHLHCRIYKCPQRLASGLQQIQQIQVHKLSSLLLIWEFLVRKPSSPVDPYAHTCIGCFGVPCAFRIYRGTFASGTAHTLAAGHTSTQSKVNDRAARLHVQRRTYHA